MACPPPRSSPNAASLKEGRPSSWPSRAGQGGQWPREGPERRSPWSLLQDAGDAHSAAAGALFTTSYPFCSKPPPRAEQEKLWLRIGPGWGWGRRGWTPPTLRIQPGARFCTPLSMSLLSPRRKDLWTSSFLSKVLHLKNQTMGQVL